MRYPYPKHVGTLGIEMTKSDSGLNAFHLFNSIGKPILGALKDEQMIVIATLVFLAVFYTPKDVFYSTVKIVPIYAVICTLKEILRAKKIYKGLEVISYHFNFDYFD